MILMLINLKESKDSASLTGITKLCGNLEHIPAPLKPFNEEVISFLSDVSEELMHDAEAKQFPDVVTFGFFCRRANITRLAKKYEAEVINRLGRGLVFHIAPSNVPINFAYTLVFGLLAGNANIVKASSKDFPQTRIVSRAFTEALCKHENLNGYVNVIMYERDRQDVTEYFSDMCNVRVIWGGDQTIENVRKAHIRPRTAEITFADRYSFAIIDPKKIIDIKNDDIALQKLARDFYNDTYLYDQNACSSPRFVYWLGSEEDTEFAGSIFWSAIYDYIKNSYEIEPVIAVNKLMAVDRTAISIDGAKLQKTFDNRIVRVQIPVLIKDLPELREAGGFFLEYQSESLNELRDVVNEKYQTIAYYGVDKDIILQFVLNSGLKGIDRIVPVGKTADIGLTWDGYDLIGTMSRVVDAR